MSDERRLAESIFDPADPGAQQTAEAVERRLAAIVESSDDAIISKSLDGIVLSWNSGAERILGYSADEMIGQPITRLEPAHRRHEMANILERLRSGERIEHFETERVAKDGRIIDLSLTVSPIRDPNNRVIGASKVARDITERKRAESALRASERRFRALVETQTEMLCHFRLDGTILFVNGAYARSQGTTAEELVGKNFWNFIPRREQSTLRNSLLTLTMASPIVRMENRFVTEDGILWTLWTNRGLEFDADGRVLEVQSTGIDITERKAMEEQLRVLNERKNQFLATLGHELRNPLAPLRSGLDLLERMAQDPASQEIREMMDRQVQHLTRLVDDLVDISRINRGRIELRLTQVDCNDVVEAALELSGPLIHEREHSFAFKRSVSPVWVHGDFDRLTQVISNLLNNSAKYSTVGGSIAVTLRRDSGHAVICVKDNGFGFPPDLANSLFDMLVRIPEHQKSTPGGLGVGLPLALQLVELHGGNIRAMSKGLGKGSRFEVRLPLIASVAQDLSTANTVDVPDDSVVLNKCHRILVVDDNVDAAISLKLLLSQRGNSVESVHDGVAAIEAVERSIPDVILLDIGLPGMNGYEVAKAIRAMPSGKNIRLYALTGWGQDDDKRRAEQAGFDGHFTKPTDVATLLRRINGQP